MMIETLPSSFSRATRSRICAPSFAPIAASGSSSRMMSASPLTTRATAIAWRRARFALHLAIGQQRQRLVRALATEVEVVVDREFVDQREILEDRVDPFGARVVDAFRFVGLAAQEHLAAVLLLKAGHDLDQRRLAR